MQEEQDGTPGLSAEAQAALAEFMANKATCEDGLLQEELPSIDRFQEDWSLSQFWCAAYCGCTTLMRL